MRKLLSQVPAALRSPNARQTEAYARFTHTLAAAAIIGAITLVFAEDGVTWLSFLAVRGAAGERSNMLPDGRRNAERHLAMDVVILLVFTAAWCGFMLWVWHNGQKRTPGDDAPRD